MNYDVPFKRKIDLAKHLKDLIDQYRRRELSGDQLGKILVKITSNPINFAHIVDGEGYAKTIENVLGDKRKEILNKYIPKGLQIK